MKRIFLCAFVFLLLSLAASAQNAGEQAILKLEQQWVDALVKADAAALEKIYADDLIYTHSSGTVDTKASYIDSLKTGKAKYESIERDDVKVRFYGDTAIVTCRSVIKVNKNTIPARYIHVYVKQKGAWRMAAHQTTRLAQ
ncbi:MAG: nuclear transport factor 2 family protein [Blastocatellia bacterium]